MSHPSQVPFTVTSSGWDNTESLPPDEDAPGKGSRSRRRAKSLACSVTAQLIQSYLDSGNEADWPEFDSDVLSEAFTDLVDEMWRRSGR